MKRRDYCTENLHLFREYLKSLSFSAMYETSEPNEAYSEFIELFKLLYDMCFPQKYVNITLHKKPKWLSKGIKTCCIRKRELLWHYRRNPNIANKNNLINYSKRLKLIIKLTRKSQNNCKINTSKNKSKTMWSIINENKENKPTVNLHD